MNHSIAFIGNGKEIHGEGEYDPFGETLYPVNGVMQSRCHLEEAIQNMTDDVMATYKSKCKTHRMMMRVSPDSPFSDAAAVAAHKYLMAWVDKYWAEVEERIEGSEPERDDQYKR